MPGARPATRSAIKRPVGALPHKEAYSVQVQVTGRGTASPVSTNVPYLSDLSIAAAAQDAYSFIRDIRTNGATIGGSFGMIATNYTWQAVSADGTVLVVFGDQTATNSTPIWWLVQNNLTNGVAGGFDAAALADTDHTGMANWAKYVAGLDPNNSNSVLYVMTPVTNGTPGTVQIQWPSVAGRIYKVQHGTNLLDAVPFPYATADQQATPPTNSCLVTVPAANQHFFRVTVRLAP